jgi:hypothetical protein
MRDGSTNDNYVVGEVTMNGYRFVDGTLGFTAARFTAADETKLKATLAAMSGVPVAFTTLTVADGATEGVVASYVMVTADAATAAAAQKKILSRAGGFQSLLKASFPYVYGGATITSQVTKQRWTAAGYEFPLNKCYTTRYKKNSLTDMWTVEQCIDTYDAITHTLIMKCFAPGSQCNDMWFTPTYNATAKCGECDKGQLAVCPGVVPPTTNPDAVPAGKYLWTVSSASYYCYCFNSP